MMDDIREHRSGPGGFPFFSYSDVEEAVKQCNFNKGLGPDGFDGNVLSL